MPALDVLQQADNGAAPKWDTPLREDTFTAFLQSRGACASANAVFAFAEGSLFSPFLFGKFFDPAEAFPLWDFESDMLLAKLRGCVKTTVDWAEMESEYFLKASIPGRKKCDVEVSGDCARVLIVSGLWRAPPEDGQDWRAGRWWEHGFVRRVELPECDDPGFGVRSQENVDEKQRNQRRG